MSRVSQFPPGTKYVPCHWCGKPVGVADNDDTYNENPFKPGHRLCQNSRMIPYPETLIYDAPLNVPKLHKIFNAIKDGYQFTDEQVKQIKKAIFDTAMWNIPNDRFSHYPDERSKPTVAKAYACKLVLLLSGCLGVQSGRNLSRKKVHIRAFRFQKSKKPRHRV